MSIDIRLETENGDSVREVLDPRGLTSWLLELGDLSATVCLRFIDPYGDAVFNQAQLPVLRAEVLNLARSISEAGLRNCKASYLERARAWPIKGQEEAREHLATLTTEELKAHVTSISTLIDQGLGEPHLYVRFAGD